MSEPLARSALHGVEEPKDLAVHLREMPERGMIDLRGLPNDEKFLAAVKEVVSADLPKVPRTSVSWGEIKLLWLSIDQWLILCPRAKAVELMAQLQTGLAGLHVALTDVSDMRSIIRLEGDGVREVLLKGCSLDLLSGDYEPGTVRRARFAEIAALIQIIDHNIIEIYVFRSYAHYAWDFLTTVARETARVKLFGEQPSPAV